MVCLCFVCNHVNSNYQQTLCKTHLGNTWQHSLGKNVRCKFQQSQDSVIENKDKILLRMEHKCDSSRCVTYFNVTNNHTVSMSVQKVFSFRISTQNQWLPPLCPGQGSKQSLWREKESYLIKQWLLCDKMVKLRRLSYSRKTFIIVALRTQPSDRKPWYLEQTIHFFF
jgi:hypothetical protein